MASKVTARIQPGNIRPTFKTASIDEWQPERAAKWQQAMDRARQELAKQPAPTSPDRSRNGRRKTSQARMLRRAAAYPPADLGWLFDPHEAPDVKFVSLTPKLALALQERMVVNRRLKVAKVTQYVRSMLQGEFPLSNQGWGIDSDGHFMDGCHRAAALVLAGELAPDIVLNALVVVGLDPALFTYIDQGANRTTGDMFDARGETDYNHMAGAAKMVLQTRQWPGDVHQRYQKLAVANYEADAVREEIGDVLRRGVILGRRMYRNVRVSIAALAATYYFLTQVAPQAEVEAFLDVLAQGGGDARAPVNRVRNRLLGRRAPARPFNPYIQMGMIIKAWNDTMTGKYSRSVAFPVDRELFPVPVPFVPGDQRNALDDE